jgi:hypothetical protein
MNFVQRAINLVVQPKAELTRAAVEPATQAGLIGGYAAILALLPAIGGLLGVFIATLRYLSAFASILLGSIISILLLYAVRDLGLTVLMGVIFAALAPNFGGQRNSIGALKLAVYAATPIWIMMFLGGLLSFTPAPLEYLFMIIGFGYAGFIIYVGAKPLLGVPEQQAPAVAAIGTIVWLVLYILLTYVLGALIGAFAYGGGGGAHVVVVG